MLIMADMDRERQSPSLGNMRGKDLTTMGKTLRKKKRAPISTITLLTIVIFCVALLSYLIPAGEYERMVNATGQTVIVPGSFHFVDSTPVSFQTLMSVFYNALIRASELIAFVLVVGGSFGVITQTGAIAAGLNKLVTKLGGKSEFIILIVMIVFCIGGASYGMTEETIPFVAIMIPVAIKIGFDPIVGVSMVIIGCYCGYSGGALNPFGTGIAQEICELPTFSGIELRIILTIGALIISAHHIISYGRKFKRRVASGELTPDCEGYVLDESIAGEIRDLNRIDKIILVILGATILILVVGVMAFKWYFEEMAALFTTMAIVAGLIYYKGDLNATMQTFVNGAKDMAGTVIVIGMARGVLVMMESGGIMDTVIYALSIPFTQLNSIFTAWGMYIVMAIINFVIPSSTGAATAVMPIFSSLADLTGITRQTAVLAFQCGDGFWNMITPAHATTMACIGIGGISFGKWFKFALPLVFKLSGWVFLVLAYAVISGYGPF